MPTFERCDESVELLARELLNRYESHYPVRDAGVTIDFVFAYADEDDEGNPKGNALSKNGQAALGITRKISLKDRACDRADAEIALDGNWWKEASDEDRAGLLDHELHHIMVVVEDGAAKRDDLGRPVIKLRHHDVEFGWFRIVAERHGKHSPEQIQAKWLLDVHGQAFWPDLALQNTLTVLHADMDRAKAKLEGVPA